MFWGRSDPRVADATPAEAHEHVKSGRAVLVDVREPHEWARGRAAGARHIPLAQLAQRRGELPKDGRVYLICASGNRSRVAAALLQRAGFADVLNVVGGTSAWLRARLPMEHG